MTWSTVVAGDGQYAQVGLPASMSRRLRFHSAVVVRLLRLSHRFLWASQLRIPPGTSSMHCSPSLFRWVQYFGALVNVVLLRLVVAPGPATEGHQVCGPGRPGDGLLAASPGVPGGGQARCPPAPLGRRSWPFAVSALVGYSVR